MANYELNREPIGRANFQVSRIFVVSSALSVVRFSCNCEGMQACMFKFQPAYLPICRIAYLPNCPSAHLPICRPAEELSTPHSFFGSAGTSPSNVSLIGLRLICRGRRSLPDFIRQGFIPCRQIFAVQRTAVLKPINFDCHAKT